MRSTKSMKSTKTENKKSQSRRKKSSVIEDLNKKIESLQLELLEANGKALSDSLNMGNFKRVAESELCEARNLLAMEKKRNECLSFAFGEFRCRELLWYASQWMRNSNFDITVNGKNISREVLIAEIDTFLSQLTFERKN